MPEVVNKNIDVFEVDKPDAMPTCITDNPAFEAVCLNHWVLQVTWFRYKQHGGMTTKGPEHTHTHTQKDN